MVHFNASVLSREFPVDGSLGLFALGFQDSDLSLEDFLIVDAVS